MNTRLFSFYLLLLLAVPAFAADFASIRPDAERLFEEKSYSRALEAYKKVNLEALGEVERRWVQFRLLDCEWRSLSSTRQPNNARLNDLVELLNREIRDLRGEDQDRVWTEVQESLGDFHWYQRHRRNWYQAWSHYQQALDWWAGSPDLDRRKLLLSESRSRFAHCSCPPRGGRTLSAVRGAEQRAFGL